MSDYKTHEEAIRETLAENGNKMDRSDLVSAIEPRFEDRTGDASDYAELEIDNLVDEICTGIKTEDGTVVYGW